MTYDIFEKYYKKLEESIDLTESICEILEKMSPEDEHDSAILRSIIAKTSERTNAKLTPEEKEILAKYNLTRENQRVLVPGNTRYYMWSDANIDSLEGGNKRERGHRKRYSNGEKAYRPSYTHHDESKVNYADIARKRPQRDQARLDRINNDKLTAYKEAQLELRNALWSREYHQEYIDKADQSYFDAIQKAKKEYDDAVKAANDARDKVDSYHSIQRDKDQQHIDSIYNRFKK